MRPSELALSALTLLAAATLGPACGDDHDPGPGTSSSSSGDTTSSSGGGTPAGCVPADEPGPVDDSCGLFVSSSLGDDATADGTKQKPYATITAALGKGSRLYLCAESFTEQVTLPAATTLYGGLDCAAGWTYTDQTKTALTAAADTIVLTLTSGAGTTSIYDLAVTAADATSAGASSIAALVDGATASFERCELTAGKPAAGAEGSTPMGTGKDGSIGPSGQPGCKSSTAVGGDINVPITDCGGSETSIGGVGGNGNVGKGGAGNDGSSAPQTPNPVVNGGLGQDTGNCESGKSGSPGAPGSPGLGATGIGSISAAGYQGATGQPGKSAGKPGQGGGGGGGARGSIACTTQAYAGPSGGGGGSGGCGGQPGQGGGPAGSSIALVSLQATVTLLSTTLTASTAMAGGKGSDGQPGGAGKGGGQGGTGENNHACPGGIGGSGGQGGAAGGGQGGHSIGIAYTGTAPTEDGVTITVATAGQGGSGGDGGQANKGGQGADGLAVDRQLFEQG